MERLWALSDFFHKEGSNDALQWVRKYLKMFLTGRVGYPIGSGVIEGTCRSLVNDRMELSGMHWSQEGAECMLELRSIKVNGLWNEYWDYHILRQNDLIYSKGIAA